MVQPILNGHNWTLEENIIWTFTDILDLCCDPDLESSKNIFPQDTPAYDSVLSN